MLPGLEAKAGFHLERDSLRQPLFALDLDAFAVVGMGGEPPHLVPGWLARNVGRPERAGARQQVVVGEIANCETGILQGDLVRIQGGTIRRQYHDEVANGIRDRAQVLLVLPELLLCALAIIDVDIDAIPVDEAALLVMNRRRGYLEPAKFAVGAA